MMPVLFPMTMMIRFKLHYIPFFLLIAIFINSNCIAQNPDFGLRLSSALNKEFSKKLDASIEYEHRFDQNLSTFDKAFLEPSLSYQLIKDVKIGAIYRVMLDQNKVREQSIKQRVAMYLRYKLSYSDFNFKFKTALQYGFDDINNASFSFDQKLINRNSIGIDYDWFGKKFKPYAEYELFYHINDPKGGIINQWRFKIGSNYKISKSSELSMYYLLEHEFNVVAPVDANIIGVGYSFSF